ncbi:uncharacterized protein LOC128881827 [Hylaeus volcanicus]|uniref:uncharacterized protein LOC128881827 n=1 Tax=Hylaeus volcanicus TaxID=313075 RepID=UPI0023B8472D|nr:uncharacterized protein LOC128881827 [Hylaeus volcanicus]XP_053989166.1 uncharacterized protein LOC128881827 [Hylaeus volcanicus]XP_053989167.1 uncharacterized protein LOC128881827 [Hylaeus volcanicus]XP_053989168.1 uncharacterized protein LOC128881827 [Hylaeus volcanicus]
MSIFNDIKKVTEIPYSDEHSLFIRQKEGKRSRKIGKPKSARNANLYDDSDDDKDRRNHYDEPSQLHESEIACSIKEYSGISYSNELIERNIKARQKTVSLNSNKPLGKFALRETSYSHSDSSTETVTPEINEPETKETILQKCKLNRNAAIMGLLKTNKISIDDLQMPNNFKCTKDNSESNLQSENASSSRDSTEGKYEMELVQLPEDPDVYLHPLQAYGSIDENKYKDIDFTVPHLGKKKTVTPLEYYLTMDDSGFDFVKKKKT